MRNMRLNEKKCKDMVINFLKYQPTVITPIQLNGIVIDRVSSYKLLGLGVIISNNDLSWNEHCDTSLETQGQIVAGGEGKYKRAGKYGTKKSKERLFSPFFTFLYFSSCIIFPPV